MTLYVFSILCDHKLKHSVLPGHLLLLLDWSVKFLFFHSMTLCRALLADFSSLFNPSSPTKQVPSQLGVQSLLAG